VDICPVEKLLVAVAGAIESACTIGVQVQLEKSFLNYIVTYIGLLTLSPDYCLLYG